MQGEISHGGEEKSCGKCEVYLTVVCAAVILVKETLVIYLHPGVIASRTKQLRFDDTSLGT